MHIKMGRTMSYGKNIYSVDMMFAYVNLFKPKHKIVNIDLYTKSLKYPGWGHPTNKSQRYSAIDVINNPKKYRKEMQQIRNANLKYPIIVVNKAVVDGMHRLAKTYLAKKKTIKAITFTKPLMRKFLINTSGNFKKADNIQEHELMQLFYKRFCKKNK